MTVIMLINPCERPYFMPQWFRNLPPIAVAATLLVLSACQTTPDEEEAFDPEQQGVTERMRYYKGEIAKTPDNPELHYRLGNALLDLGNYQDAYRA